MRFILIIIFLSPLYAAKPPRSCEANMQSVPSISMIRSDFGVQKGLTILINNLLAQKKYNEVLSVESEFSGKYILDVIRDEFAFQIIEPRAMDVEYVQFLYEKYQEFSKLGALSAYREDFDVRFKKLSEQEFFWQRNHIQEFLPFYFIENRFDDFYEFYELMKEASEPIEIFGFNYLALHIGNADFFYRMIEPGELEDYLGLGIGKFLTDHSEKLLEHLKETEKRGPLEKNILVGEILSHMVIDRNYSALFHMFYELKFPRNDFYHFSLARQTGLAINNFDMLTIADFAHAHLDYMSEEIENAINSDIPAAKELIPTLKQKEHDFQTIVNLINSFEGRKKINVIPSQTEIELLRTEYVNGVFLKYNYVFYYLMKGAKWDLFFELVRKQTYWKKNGKPDLGKFNEFLSFLNEHGSVEAGIELLERINPYFQMKNLPTMFAQERFHEELSKKSTLTRERFFMQIFNINYYDILADLAQEGLDFKTVRNIEMIEARINALWSQHDFPNRARLLKSLQRLQKALQ